MTQVIRTVNEHAIDEMALRFGWRKQHVRKSILTHAQQKIAVELNSRFVATEKGIMKMSEFQSLWKAYAGRKFLEKMESPVGPNVALPMDGEWVVEWRYKKSVYTGQQDAAGHWIYASESHTDAVRYYYTYIPAEDHWVLCWARGGWDHDYKFGNAEGIKKVMQELGVPAVVETTAACHNAIKALVAIVATGMDIPYRGY